MPSAYATAIPKKPDTHSQNIPPGPPSVSAVATPVTLPVPTVAASAVEIHPSLEPSEENRFLLTQRNISAILSCTSLVLKLKYTPTDIIRITVGIPQTASETAVSILFIATTHSSRSGYHPLSVKGSMHMRKYRPKTTALLIINIAVILLCTGLTVVTRIYLVSFRILMILLIALFWAAAVLFCCVLLPLYFRRTVVYVSGIELCLHTGIFFWRREYMRMSAVQYVTSVSLPLSGFSGFNFIFVRGLGGTLVLPFLRSADCDDIINLIHIKITERQ